MEHPQKDKVLVRLRLFPNVASRCQSLRLPWNFWWKQKTLSLQRWSSFREVLMLPEMMSCERRATSAGFRVQREESAAAGCSHLFTGRWAHRTTSILTWTHRMADCHTPHSSLRFILYSLHVWTRRHCSLPFHAHRFVLHKIKKVVFVLFSTSQAYEGLSGEAGWRLSTDICWLLGRRNDAGKSAPDFHQHFKTNPKFLSHFLHFNQRCKK